MIERAIMPVEEQNQTEVENEFSQIDHLLHRELRRTNGVLTPSAGNIFADLLDHALESAENLGVNHDYFTIVEDFMPTIAQAPEGSSLNKTGLSIIQRFHNSYGKQFEDWNFSLAYNHANVFLRALVNDDEQPVAMPVSLASGLNKAFCDQATYAIDAFVCSDDKTQLADKMDDVEDDQDKILALTKRFADQPKEQARLQSVLTGYVGIFAQIKVALGLSDEVAIVSTMASSPNRPQRGAQHPAILAPGAKAPLLPGYTVK